MLILVPLAAQPLKVRQGKETLELPLERYVAGVLAGECSVFRSPEAIKAMAVAARTYAVRLRGRHSAEGFDFCATTHCQRLDLESVRARLEGMAAQTAGELLWFAGKPAFTCYTRDCGGRAEDAAAVWPDLGAPYLKSHEDAYCGRAGSSAWQWSGDPKEIAGALIRSRLRAPPVVERVEIAQRTASGRARTLVLWGKGESVRISAGSFRFAVGRGLGWNTLLSDRYEVQWSNGRVVFEGAGAGHGVGLCQRGADQMGTEGHSYREILAYYYPGAEAGLTGRGLAWQRLGGEGVTLLTTQPERDRVVAAMAERSLRDVCGRTGLAAQGKIEVRVYPDVETFRNATGEPGWIAAHTRGRRIEMQPAGTLRSRGVLEQTLRHEMLHVLIESHAAPGLALWFREGLAGVLDGEQPGEGAARTPSDAELRQTADAARARRAYGDAARAVAGLVKQHGLAAVMGWLKTGLPREVNEGAR